MSEQSSQAGNPYQSPQQAIGGGETQNQLNLKLLIGKFIFRYWYLYVYTITLGLLTAYFYNWYATPVYFTSCSVLIKDDKQKHNSNDLIAQLNEFNTEGGIETEIGIIRSRQLIYKTLESLDFAKSYFLKGEIKTSEMYKESPIKLMEDTLYPIAYSTGLSLEIIDDRKFKIRYNHPTGPQTGYHLFGKRVISKLGVFRIEKTDKFKDDVYRKPEYTKRKILIRFQGLDNLTDQYQAMLKVDKVSKASTILQASVQGPVPKKNEDFLNRLFELYIGKGIELKNEYAVNTLRFIDEQVNLLTQDIDANEANVERFRITRGITDLDVEATSYLESVKNFDAKISELQVQVSFLNYLEKYVADGREMSGNISPGSILVNDPLLTNLILRINELENKRKSQSVLAKQDNPLLVGINIELQNTKASLLENIRSLRAGLNSSLREAMTQKESVQGKLRLLP
ncbi:MAG: hypothetical protein ACKOQY_01025, partial [Bacteroidota bacterium]